jgi:hypothetical protein
MTLANIGAPGSEASVEAKGGELLREPEFAVCPRDFECL